MQNSCDKWAEIIKTGQLEDLSSSEHTELEKHLQTCLLCTRHLDNAIAEQVRTVVDNETMPELTPRLLKLNQDIVQQRRQEHLQGSSYIASRKHREEEHARLKDETVPLLSRMLAVALVLGLIFIFWTALASLPYGSSCNGVNNCNNDNTDPSSSGIPGTVTDPSSGGIPGTVSCLGYEKTDPEIPDQGETVTFNVTVPDGCVVIVQGVAGQNVGPYNWNNGAVAALGPGSYSFTIQDGSYQMTSDANAQATYCTTINWIQANGKALSEAYPLPGWGSC